MSNKENDRYYEDKRDAFHCYLYANSDQESLLVDKFATFEETWAAKEIAAGDEYMDMIDRVFDKAFEIDMELVGDPAYLCEWALENLSTDRP